MLQPWLLSLAGLVAPAAFALLLASFFWLELRRRRSFLASCIVLSVVACGLLGYRGALLHEERHAATVIVVLLVGIGWYAVLLYLRYRERPRLARRPPVNISGRQTG